MVTIVMVMAWWLRPYRFTITLSRCSGKKNSTVVWTSWLMTHLIQVERMVADWAGPGREMVLQGDSPQLAIIHHHYKPVIKNAYMISKGARTVQINDDRVVAGYVNIREHVTKLTLNNPLGEISHRHLDCSISQHNRL